MAVPDRPSTFFGICERRKVVNRFEIALRRYPSGMTMPKHQHEYAYLSFLLSGSYVERDRGNERISSPGTAQLYPAGIEHSDEIHGTSAALLLVRFPETWVADLKNAGLAMRRARLNGPDLFDTALKLHQELMNDAPASAIACEGLALELLSHTLASDDRYDPWTARDAQDVIHEHLADPLGLGVVARMIGVHPTHLARSFKQRYRVTVGEYIRRVRIDAARRKIAETDLPLSEIALSTGFADQSHLTRVFRQAYGTTPSLLRRRTRRRSVEASTVPFRSP